MKKHVGMLTICSLTLLLSACGDNNPKVSNSNGIGGSSLIGGSSNGGNSSIPGPIESGSTGGGHITPPSSSIDYTIGWSQDVLDVMQPHLGGHVIPFIDLPGRILATWSDGTPAGYYSEAEPARLSILSTGAFDAALAGAAKLTYQKAGWKVDFDRVTYAMTAIEENLGITVDFHGEYDANDKTTTPQIFVYFEEPFLIPTGGSWRRETLEALESIGIAAPHALPYTYLGTLAEEISILGDETNGYQALIKGKVGSWNTYKNQIIAAAKNAFPRSKKWAEASTYVNDGYNDYAATSFTKSFSDGYTIEALLFGADLTSYYGDGDPTPYLLVECTHQ
ncbi:MAG: hypothetical protein J6328_04535 [Bacilli bacterium]|nr:hypothetical protein [Bacilli bacterium]